MSAWVCVPVAQRYGGLGLAVLMQKPELEMVFSTGLIYYYSSRRWALGVCLCAKENILHCSIKKHHDESF